MTVLFACERMSSASPTIYALYLTLFIFYLASALVDLLLQALQQTKATRRVSVSVGMRLTAVGCVFGLTYSAYKVTVLASLELGLHLVSEQTRCSSLVQVPCVFSVTSPALSVLCISVGLTLPAIAYPVSQARRRSWETRSLSDLRPLWTDLASALPQIVLPGADGDGDVGTDPGFLLQRRVIEISDALLTLRPYSPKSVRVTAEEFADVTTREGAAIVEAALIRAALVNLRLEHHPFAVAELPTLSCAWHGEDLRAETERLLAIARAYARGESVRLDSAGRSARV